MIKAILSLFLLLNHAEAFVPAPIRSTGTTASTGINTELYSIEPAGGSPIDGFVDDIKMRIRIAQESNAKGLGTKQVIADVLAGEYDDGSIVEKINELKVSAPCVMFTWESSPSCKKAVEAFDTIGADVKIVRLDDPWAEGNPMRAQLGKMVGRTSVPFVFIKGEYVGGFDGGLEGNDDASGMVNMAFKGTLRSKLSEAGAMKA